VQAQRLAEQAAAKTAREAAQRERAEERQQATEA